MPDGPKTKKPIFKEVGSLPIEDGETVIHADERTVVHPEGPSDRSRSTSVDDAAEQKEGRELTAYLKASSGPLAGRKVYLKLEDGQGYILGRDENAQLVLNDGSVSRRHAEIVRRGVLHTISDLGSSNGTLVDGQLIHQEHTLRNGSEIRIGVCALVFSDPNLKDEDVPSTLPVPYDAQRARSGALAEPGKGVLAEIGKPLPEAARRLIGFYVVLGVFGLLLLVFGIRKIMREETGGGFVRALQGILDGGPQGPDLAYPLVEIRVGPIPGEIYFQGEYWGTSPQERKLTNGVRPGDEQAIRVEFDLPQINEKVVVEQKVTFTKNQEVAPFVIDAPIGMVHVKRLPDDTQVILEYHRAAAPSEDAVKPEQLNTFSPQEEPQVQIRQPRIDYKEPIFVPFGRYKFEVRREEKFRYRRRFVIDASNQRWEVSLTEEDLTYTPLSITTEPAQADIYLDGLLLELKTPIENFRLPFGDHSIVLRKENYEDLVLEELPKPIQINEPLVYTFTLPLSGVGELILHAKKDYQDQRWAQAEDTLFRALKFTPPPTPLETTEIQYYLGLIYLNKGDVKQALIYFRKAKNFVTAEGERSFYDKARVGEARVYQSQGNRLQALKLSVEVFFESKDPVSKAAAEEVFHNLSPAFSTLRLDSDPPGAMVYFNGKLILSADDGKSGKLTPMIVPDLPVGAHTLVFSKEGYEDHKEIVRLKTSDLKGLKVQLLKKPTGSEVKLP